MQTFYMKETNIVEKKIDSKRALKKLKGYSAFKINLLRV